MAKRLINPDLVRFFRNRFANHPDMAFIISLNQNYAMIYLKGINLSIDFFQTVTSQQPSYWPDPSRDVSKKIIYRPRLIYLDYDIKINAEELEILQNIVRAPIVEWVPSNMDFLPYNECKKGGLSTEHLFNVSKLIKIFETNADYNCVLPNVTISPDGTKGVVEIIYTNNRFVMVFDPKTYRYIEIRDPNKLTTEERANVYDILHMIELKQLIWKRKTEFRRLNITHVELAARLKEVFARHPSGSRLVQYIDYKYFETHMRGSTLKHHYIKNGMELQVMHIDIRESTLTSANYSLRDEFAIILEKIFINLCDGDQLQEWKLPKIKPVHDPVAELKLKHDKIRADQKAILDNHVFKHYDGRPDHASFADLARKLSGVTISNNIAKLIIEIIKLIDQKVSENSYKREVFMHIIYMGSNLTLRVEKRDGADKDMLSCHVEPARMIFIDPECVNSHPDIPSILIAVHMAINSGTTYWHYRTRSLYT